ncbi:MAG: helix-turn-helix transcriptional regulator [Gammaproteobacteria bacterium]|nr:helix-turn-helix transcriptional regulator [Gammaproteobacteria bacterium]
MASIMLPAEEQLPRFLNVRQVADYLQLNEKKIYALVNEGKIPGTKITGKWMFPRELIDRWLLESSHGGLLADRLLISGSDDPLFNRIVMKLAGDMQSRTLVSYTATGTKLGLELLSRHRADVCAMHWGPASQSRTRHPALLSQFSQHNDWVLIRMCKRQQGLMIRKDRFNNDDDILAYTKADTRWAMRQQGAGSQRFLLDILQQHHIEMESLTQSCIAYSERDAATKVVMDEADVALGAQGAATEAGLAFIPLGWEAFDLALYRGIYFRNLFQALLQELGSEETRRLAKQLGGYDFDELGDMVWSA